MTDKNTLTPQSSLQPTPKPSSNGSATGNPRNKTALKPGYSLLGWVRLGNSGVDLTGTNGKIAAISTAELAKHNTKEDAWMAVKGKVYNVTRYMDYHPGGPEELLRGVGTDATKLFEEYHAWVNYEQLLSKCFVGPLKNSVSVNLKNLLKLPPKLSNNNLKDPKPTESNESSLFAGLKQKSFEPRFDWMQKTQTLNLIFYTKSLCNPGLILMKTDDKEIDVKICLVNSMFQYKFNLFGEVLWPGQTKITQETGKIEAIFTKKEPELWKSIGTFESKKITEFEVQEFDYEICERAAINHDSYAVLLRPKAEILQIVPIGFHLSITGKVSGEFEISFEFS